MNKPNNHKKRTVERTGTTGFDDLTNKYSTDLKPLADNPTLFVEEQTAEWVFNQQFMRGL